MTGRPGTPGTQSPGKFAHHLEGVEWPADKAQLLEKARSTAAPPEVLEAILQLPGTRYDDLREVILAYEARWPPEGPRG